MSELINGRTPEEIKQALEWMKNGCPTPETDCEECRHHEICKEITSVYTPGDALAYIERLEAKLAEKDERIEALREMME